MVMAVDPRLQELFAEPLLEQLSRRATAGARPVVGLNGPVGAGKSTLCQWLQREAGRRGLQLAVASIDDFYLPWGERQRRLAGNPFGVSRVPPGSHDTGLLLHCLNDWRSGGSLRLPRFDKTLRGGQGDRSGEVWMQAQALVLEGWLVGCQPLDPLHLTPVLAAWPGPEALRELTAEAREWLPRWNDALRAYTAAWQQLDDLWLLRPCDWSYPRRWRFQAEARQRRQGGAWLSGQELEALVQASVCCLPPGLYQQPLEAVATRVAWLDSQRRCRRVQVQPSADSSSLVG